MKKCPQCGREYDLSMMFCLDDGAELLYGPASESPASADGQFDEPQTAILQATAPPAEAATRAQVFGTAGEIESRPNLSRLAQKQSVSARRAVKPLVALVTGVVVLGSFFFGYRYFLSTNQIESIAVMPFVNDSGNAEVEYLSDGMTETLIRSLSNLENIDVKPRSAVFRYKGKDSDVVAIGRELNVKGVLNGRIVQRGEQLTLNLELVDALRNRVVWSEQYVRKTSDLVSLQSEIAKDVSTKLRSKLSGADAAKVERNYTTNSEAYQLYLKGRFYWNKRDAANLQKAIEHFKAAAAVDPNYALAYAGLADSYVLAPQNLGMPGHEAFPQAKAYAERALAIDEQLAQSHAALGLINHYLWNWTEAEKEFRRAIELDPNYATAHQWYSSLLGSLGRSDEGLAEIKRAHELDPLSMVILLNLGLDYMERGDYETGIAQLKKIYEIDPNFEPGHLFLGIAYFKQGRSAEALSELRTSVDLTNRKHESLAILGHVLASTGNRDEALALMKEIKEDKTKDPADSFHVATIYAGLGDSDQAFAWLEKAFQERSHALSQFKEDILWKPLRDDPRYKNLLKRMNLPE